VWAAIEYAKRLVADQRKLSLRFGVILGMLKEADYWARQSKAETISADRVHKAISQHRFRYNRHGRTLF